MLYLPAGYLVEKVGIENAYVVAFLVSLVAGFSSFTGTAAYATVIEFSRSGINPLYLGLTAGLGLFFSDSLFYFLVMKGRDSVEHHLEGVFSRIQRIMKRVPDALVYLGTFIFCAVGPIPNDLILVSLVAARYRYRQFWPVILLGDIAFMLFLSYIFTQ